MNDYSYWAIFISTAILLNISPGPDMIYLISRTMSQGKKTGIATALGLGTGAFVHTIFVAVGISALLAASALAFTILKYIGAAYLFYLGIKTFLSGGIACNASAASAHPSSFRKAYYQAIVIDVLNPKVAIFFLAFLPQFYRADHGSRGTQFILLGLIIIAIGFVIESLVVLASSRISEFLKRSRRTSKFIDNLLGTVFIGLGVRLLFEKNS
jgi:threonine/homoserine/homoserine lactone efflux protein